MANIPTPMPETETDFISAPGGDELTDRVTSSDWNVDDAQTFVSEVTSGIGGQESQSLMTRVESLAQAFQTQRSTAERLLVRAGKSTNPVLQDKMARQMSIMYHNHELAFKLIGKLQQAVETITKMQ